MAESFDLKLGSPMPGASWAGLWLDNRGIAMITDAYGKAIRGSVMIDPEMHPVQADAFSKPVKHLKLRVQLDGVQPYEVMVPLAAINGSREDFVTTMESKALPEGIKCTQALRDAMYAASFAPESWKTHDRDFVSQADGLWHNGQRLANFQFIICGQTTNQYGEKAFILRKDTGERITVDAAEMPTGGYAWRFGGNCTVYDPISTFIHLKRQYAEMTDFQRREYELEPLRKEEERIRKELAKKSQTKFPGLSNDHLQY